MNNKSFRIVNASYTNFLGHRVHRFYLLFPYDVVMWSAGWTGAVITCGAVTGAYAVQICYNDHTHRTGAAAVKEIDGEYTLAAALNMARNLMRRW